MGIQEFRKYITLFHADKDFFYPQHHLRQVFTERNVGVDFMCVLHIAGNSKTSLVRSETKEANTILKVLKYFQTILTYQPATIHVCIDTNTPTEKIETIKKRYKSIDKSMEKYNLLKSLQARRFTTHVPGVNSKVIMSNKVSNAIDLSGPFLPSRELKQECLKKLASMDDRIKIVYAKDEGERELSYMYKTQTIDTILSGDSDCAAYTSSDGYYLIQQCAFNDYLTYFDKQKFLQHAGISPEIFRDICICLGTDYNDRIKSFGPVTAKKNSTPNFKLETMISDQDLLHVRSLFEV